jgi:ABC-type transport system substrate-binding protein
VIDVRRVFALALFAASLAAHAADPNKVLRLASSDIEPSTRSAAGYSRATSPQSSTRRCANGTTSISSSGTGPAQAAALPAISADGKTWTIKVKPGIRFTDDPAFKGKPRELVAEDYVYSIKRYLDPNLRGGGEPMLADLIVGMRAVVDAASKPGAKFDYDAPVEGLQRHDRHGCRWSSASNPPASPVSMIEGGARSGQPLRRHQARGRHRPLPLEGMAARSRRARGQS